MDGRHEGMSGAGHLKTMPPVRIQNLIEGDRFLCRQNVGEELSCLKQIDSGNRRRRWEALNEKEMLRVVTARVIKWDEDNLWRCHRLCGP